MGVQLTGITARRVGIAITVAAAGITGKRWRVGADDVILSLRSLRLRNATSDTPPSAASRKEDGSGMASKAKKYAPPNSELKLAKTVPVSDDEVNFSMVLLPRLAT